MVKKIKPILKILLKKRLTQKCNANYKIENFQCVKFEGRNKLLGIRRIRAVK